MRRIYYLSTCSTCTRILKLISTEDTELIDLKKQNISPEDLDLMKANTGNYESLFNKRAQKYKSLTEDEKPVNDGDYRTLILKEYTFLKRPAAIIGDKVIVGNNTAAIDTFIKEFGSKN